MGHMSCVKCQVSSIEINNFLDKVVELVGEGLLSTGPTPFSFI